MEFESYRLDVMFSGRLNLECESYRLDARFRAYYSSALAVYSFARAVYFAALNAHT